jgi:hypothetical protein
VDYQRFEKYMNMIRDDYEWMDRVSETLGSDTLYERLQSQGGLFLLLSEIFDDNVDDWIGYFIFELDWGKDYEDGRVKDKDGTNVPLATLKDLYNLLTKKKEGSVSK